MTHSISKTLAVFMATIVCMFGGCTGTRPTDPNDPNYKNPNVVSEVRTNDFSPAKNTRVTLILLDHTGQVIGGNGAIAETECINALMSKGYEVVDRSQLDAILREQKMSQSGLTNEGDAVRAGKIANVKGLFLVQVASISIEDSKSGSLINWNSSDLDITARWSDVESGVIKWSAHGKRSVGGLSIPFTNTNHRNELTELVKETILHLPDPR